ncbi:MAG: DUF4105 domain-containing protein [bacterium]|nr:DUF4105 domain-containing protein [bacterium]
MEAFIILAFFSALCIVAYYQLRQPSNRGPWAIEHAVAPYATFEGERITIHNVRTFDYYSTKSHRIRYESRVYDLSKLKHMDYILEDFMQGNNTGHVFISFGFENGIYIAFSIEARRRPGQEFSAYVGLLKRYELIYIASDEHDVLKLRAVHRNDDVRVYPIKATTEDARRVFISIIERMNKLRTNPEFYNSISNACGTNLFAHLRLIYPKLSLRRFPAIFLVTSDAYLLTQGVFDTDLSIHEARSHFLVNKKAHEHKDEEDFSLRIRTTVPHTP